MNFSPLNASYLSCPPYSPLSLLPLIISVLLIHNKKAPKWNSSRAYNFLQNRLAPTVQSDTCAVQNRSAVGSSGIRQGKIAIFLWFTKVLISGHSHTVFSTNFAARKRSKVAVYPPAQLFGMLRACYRSGAVGIYAKNDFFSQNVWNNSLSRLLVWK